MNHPSLILHIKLAYTIPMAEDPEISSKYRPSLIG
jgi:hypothetical protein